MLRFVEVAWGGLWAMGWPARMVLIGVVRLYRVTLSGLLGGQCRFHPSCSVYAEGAIGNRGAVVGSVLAVWRILRCSPLSRGGIDPAPGALGRPARRASRPSAVYDGIIPTPSGEGVRP
jgi:putative membrane protein insertion efficiency factor